MEKGVRMPKWDWHKLSLRMVLICVLVPVTLLPLIVFYFWSNAVSLQRQIDDVSDRHLLIARNVGAALSRYHLDILSAFDILTNNVLAGTDFHSGNELLKNLSFHHLCIAEAKGGNVLLVIRSDDKPSDRPHRPKGAVFPRELIELFNRIATSEKPVLSGVVKGPDDKPTIFIVSRHGDKFAIAALRTDYFVELGKSISFGRKGHAAIVDQNGSLLAHPLPAWRQSMKNIAKLDPVKRILKGETGISQFYSPAVKADMIAGFTAVKGTGWGVMIPQPFSELEENAAAANNSAFLVLFIGFLVSIAIGLVLAWRFTDPLGSVIRAARDMAEGKPGARALAPNRRFVPAEIQELHDAFNSMAESVEQARKTEESLRQKAEDANRAKTIFLASMSHELRTPLNAIIGFAEVLLKDGFEKLGEEKSRDYLKNVLSGGQHLLDLINNILDLSRLELGEAQLEYHEISLARAIERAATMVSPIAETKKQELIIDVANDVTLWADEMRFRQIVINLASNAVRFTQEGGRIELTTSETSNGGLAIQVADNGPGIDADDIERLMEPFQRGEDALRQGINGVGLGLGIVASLAEAHGAKFNIRSTPGKGTVATVTFPSDKVLDQERKSA
jgi:signal transduction histidine kinase